jgi:hypothetical protein
VTNAEAKRKWALTGLHSAAVAAVAIWANYDTGNAVFSFLATLSGVVTGVCLAAVITIHLDYEGR